VLGCGRDEKLIWGLMGYLKERKIFKPGHRWASGFRMYCKEREWKDMDLILVA
jgi:hypothetical protein